MKLAFIFVLILGIFQLINAEKYRVLISHPEVPQEAFDLLSKTTDVIVCESLTANRTELIEKGNGVHALLWATHEPLNAKMLDAIGPQLKVVSTLSAGFNNIDVDELKKRKIPLGNTPNVLNAAVADQAIGLMISAARRFHEGRQKIESSNWETEHLNWMLGQDISGATIGFFGFGKIGRTIAKRLAGFDVAEILYATRRPIDTDIEKKLNARKVDFPTMLSSSDIVFVAAPLSDETRGVFNRTAFSKMKKNSVFINIARGPIVRQDDLYEALKTNQIFAAGIDVTDPEPLQADDPILKLPNCVITPHIASATRRTRTDMAILAANNILQGLTGKPLPAPVY